MTRSIRPDDTTFPCCGVSGNRIKPECAVNLLAYAFEGSNPSLPTTLIIRELREFRAVILLGSTKLRCQHAVLTERWCIKVGRCEEGRHGLPSPNSPRSGGGTNALMVRNEKGE